MTWPVLRPLRGREQHIAQIEAGLHTVANTGKSHVLLVQAAHGAGKTRLLIEATSIATRNRFAVVNKMSTIFDFAPWVTLKVSSTQIQGSSMAEDGFSFPCATSTVKEIRAKFRDILARGRVLVALDDLHLIDLVTLLALCELIASLNNHPILWILAFSSKGNGMPHGPMEICLSKLRAERIKELGPLSSDAVTQLVTDYLGATPNPAIITLADNVGGTPRAVIGLTRGLLNDGDVRIADGIAQLRLSSHEIASDPVGVRTPGPVPNCFVEIVHNNLRSLSPLTIKVLKLAAILGSPFTPMELSGMLDKSPIEWLAALDEALAFRLLICRANDFAFRSDAIWRVVLDLVPSPVGALLHRQAATMLLSQPDGMEAAALHLIHIAQPGDTEAVQIISKAAGRLLASDPLTAASLAARGMELLGPKQAERILLATTAVEAYVKAGRLQHAIEMAKGTIKEIAKLEQQHSQTYSEATASLQSWMSVALLLQGNAHEAGWAARDALALAADEPEYHEQAELSRLASYCLIDESAAARLAEEILGSPSRYTRAVEASALTVHAFELWRSGHMNDAIQILRKAVELNHIAKGIQLLDPRWVLASMLTKIGEFDEAMAVINVAAQMVLETKASAAISAILQAPVHLANGCLTAAEENARIGIEAIGGLCVPMLAPQAWRVQVLVALRRGALNAAEDHLITLERCLPRDASRPWWAMRFLLRAQIAEAKIDSRAAMEILADVWVTERMRCELILEDSSAAAWCVRSALEADMQDIARIIVDTAEELRMRNRNLHAVQVSAMHAHALLDGDADALAQVSRLHRDPWAQAAATEDRAHLLIAHEDRETAVTELECAMSTYDALGGERDAARLRRELRHLGVRRRHWTHAKRPVSGWESLTKTERKVAELVANGLTNRQVASELFVSPHTVGFHLRQIYRKLSLRSRIDLIRLKS
jgi:DNA-binding CsgD family transcriptional regulator